jgi:peptidoglycan hydrolase CwlO-like protein
MKYYLLLIMLGVIGLVMFLEMNNLKKVLFVTSSRDNPNNINLQLENNQNKVDNYDNQIEDVQTKTDDALKATNK